MGRAIDPAVLLDALAQSLILIDPEDAATVSELLAAFAALRSWARRHRVARAEVAAFGEAADRLAEGDGGTSVVEELEEAFASLQRVIATAARGGRTERRAPSEAVPAAAPAEAAATPSATPLAGDEELLRDFVARAGEYLETADEQLVVLEKDPADAEALNSVFRAFHTIKGMAGFLALGRIERVAHDTETVLDGPRRGAGPLDRAGFDSVFAAVDEMKAEVARVLPGAVPPPAAPAGETPASGRTARAVAGTKTTSANNVRVDEERLDRLLDTIGELVIAESMFSETAKTGGDPVALGVQLTRLDKITRELQEMATTLRMVPLRSTFARMARLVRDVSHKAGKSVDLVTSGGDTELDKLVVDRIYDPLVHILRNAVDHGIEPAGERRSAGKPETGRIELRAFHAGGGIYVQVVDDGRGFDTSGLLAAARQRGLVGADEVPAERDLRDLAFVPGLSTAPSVTGVSGRGVGMDVVRRTVESLRGDVDIATRPGEGTEVSIRLPLTLAIIDGMVVRVGEERYIVPTLSIERSVRPEREQLSGVLGETRMLSLGGSLVPLVQLGRLFDASGARTDPAEGIVVVVSENGERVGLVACEILGQQQIVIKPLGDGMQDVEGVAGAAIMPDGRVGLIVDVGGLVKLARNEVREVAS